jgi:hydroxymethylglutaryl-CoA reductase
VSKIHKNLDIERLKTGGLDLTRADSMIENCIGLISIPVGLGYTKLY